jgi:hypothetical protein
MVVNVTPNINLFKPTESELAENWVSGMSLADGNNFIIEAKATTEITTYTPTFIASTTDPAVGSTGSIQGEYYDFQGYIVGSVVIKFNGAGISSGVGSYAISLPAVADGAFHNVGAAIPTVPGTFSCIGEGYVSDASSVATSGSVSVDVITIAGTSYARLNTETYVGKTTRLFAAGQPFSFAAGDQVSFNFIYKKQ